MNKLFSFSAENVAKSVYGESGTGSEHTLDPMIYQGYDSTCAVRSQQIILRDFGVDMSQEQLMEFAENNGWYSEEDGTPMGYVGYILQTCGVDVHQKTDCTMYDLVNELSQGHRIIVGVDAEELWDDGFMGLKGDWNDLVHGETPNHALIVAGVEVNPNDPDDVNVVLTDPGSGDLRITYKLDQFMDAWQDSNCFMVATDEAAPYQYDPVTGREIPSNFYTEAFIENNSYPLSEEDLVVPDGYLSSGVDGHLNAVGAAYSEGHLDTIPIEDSEGVNHEIDYSKYKQALHGVNTLGTETFSHEEFEKAFLQLLGLDADDQDDDLEDDLDEIDNDSDELL